jgi:hypothetical protein
MGKLLASREISVTSGTSILGFSRPPTENWPNGFDRYLTVEGNAAFHIGNICGTCPPLFERLHGAHRKVSAPEATAQLRDGLTDLPDDLLQTVSSLAPPGRYVATLLVVRPAMVQLGSWTDYFTREQVDLWGVDPFWGLPHYPKTEYYRSETTPFDDEDCLFELMVPMYPQNWLHETAVEQYGERLIAGDQPTAMALSVLDIKQPANWSGSPSITKHWSFTHYLLDGHHKTFAASLVGKPLTLLSLLALDECMVESENDIERLLRLLRTLP